MPRPEPIRVNDRFRDSRGAVWRVYRTLPPGRVEIVSGTRLISTYLRQLRIGNWTRVEPTPSAESLSYGVRCPDCGEWETSCTCEASHV